MTQPIIHNHPHTLYWSEDCPSCRKQRYGAAERTSVTDDSIATTMTTTAALDTATSVSSDSGSSSACDPGSSGSDAGASGADGGC